MEHVWYLISQWMAKHLHVSDTMAIRLLFLQRALFPHTARLKASDDFPSCMTKYRKVTRNPLSDVNCVYELVMNFLIKRVPCPMNDLHILHLGRMIDRAHLYCSIRSTIRADVYGAATMYAIRNTRQRVLWRAFVDPEIENWMGVDTLPGSDPHVTIWFFRNYLSNLSTVKADEVQALACALRKHAGFTVHFIMQTITSLQGYGRFDVENNIYNPESLSKMKLISPEILGGLSQEEREKWNSLIKKLFV